MAKYSRRQFLEDSMFAATAAVAANSRGKLFAAEEAQQSKSPNERLSVAVVGVNGRGQSHLAAYSKRQDAEVTYIVDADISVGNARAAEIGKATGRTPKVVQDMRHVFDDKSVDVVSTATPNHWHALVAIWAMQAGKDVYVEKPVSHNVSEGRRIVETARKYNKICQTGTQSRSMAGLVASAQYLRDGKIGEVKLARGLCYKFRPPIGKKGNYPIPTEVNYDLWLGPAPNAPLTREKLHYDWHWQWAYGNGDLGNQGIHQMDMARWGLGLDGLSKSVLSYGGRLGYPYEDAGEVANTQVVIHDYGDKSLVFEVRGLKTEAYKGPKAIQNDANAGAKIGVIFTGSDGYLVTTTEVAVAFDKEGKKLTEFTGAEDYKHFANFIDAIRSRDPKELNADILEGHRSSALCHLGNISYRLGTSVSAAEAKERVQSLKTTDSVSDTFDRTVQHLSDNGVDLGKTRLQLGQMLAFDPENEKFLDNSAADAMLTREYRAPFVVPAAGKV